MAVTECIVIKLGGEVLASPYMAAIAADVAQLQKLGDRVVIVHGGGPQTTDLQKRLGQPAHIVAGRRITDAEALEVVKMVVAGKLNVDACAALIAAGTRPVGLHGASSLVVKAQKRPPRVVTGAGAEPIDFGHVGDVTGVNGQLIELLSSVGYVPVIACLGADQQGDVFNINADSVARRLALALDARALVLVSDVPGVLRDVRDPSSRIPRLTVADGRKAISDGIVKAGMIPKLEESFAALSEGVKAVHIVGRLQRGELATEMDRPGSVGSVLLP